MTEDIIHIQPKSLADLSQSQYQKIVSLWKRHSNKLGELPESTKLRDYLSKQKFIVAMDRNGDCIAYSMFREIEQNGQILHVCVDKNFRRKGLGKELVKQVINSCQHLNELRVSCRRDYGLDDLWQSLDFVARADKTGRNYQNKLITEWRLSYGHNDLLSLINEQIAESKLCVSIDTNIFIDLTSQDTSRNTQDSKVLLSDWLYPHAEFFLTEEVFNDLNRITDDEERKQTRERINHFKMIQPEKSKIDLAKGEIEKYFPENPTPQDLSDMMHIARAIAGECQCFITRDTDLLDLDSQVYDEFGISILRPSDFILYMDELLEEVKYQPARLSSTNIEVSRVKYGQQEFLAQQFLNLKSGEKKSALKEKIRASISNSNNLECMLVSEKNQDSIIAFYVIDRREPNELRIPIFRIDDSCRVAGLIARHLLFLFIKKCMKESRFLLRIQDDQLSEVTIESLQIDRYFPADKGYLKYVLPFADDADNLSDTIISLAHGENAYINELVTQLSRKDVREPENTKVIEKIFFPLKILDSEISNFIIPIQPRWAEELIDEELAALLIMGARKELWLRREMVYYRATRPRILEAPARILWYVSSPKSGRSFPDTMCIKACSILDDVTIDDAEAAYKKFRRFGVYRKEDVLKASSGKHGEIMAVHFSDTQAVTNPINLKKIHEILYPKKPPLITPYKISNQAFSELYREGFCT